jgi:hypothetical protein
LKGFELNVFSCARIPDKQVRIRFWYHALSINAKCLLPDRAYHFVNWFSIPAIENAKKLLISCQYKQQRCDIQLVIYDLFCLSLFQSFAGRTRFNPNHPSLSFGKAIGSCQAVSAEPFPIQAIIWLIKSGSACMIF